MMILTVCNIVAPSGDSRSEHKLSPIAQRAPSAAFLMRDSVLMWREGLSDATVANYVRTIPNSLSSCMTSLVVHTARTCSQDRSHHGCQQFTFLKGQQPNLPNRRWVSLNSISDIINNNNYPFLAGLNGQQQQQSNNVVLQNTGNNNIVNSGDNQPFVTAGQLPSGLAAGNSCSDPLLTATPISALPLLEVLENNAKGMLIETMPHVDQHTTDGVETITHFTVYITP
ncbi:hypothetical protein HAX54_049790 [Datura stramonium]|uniref:Uncharacterized protein n=1 Tax=Datura stramonium TaxID=4076 RepID=A0ABS8SX39_DATST|nr:hypothetical protein [Datura stramonium]